MPYLYIHSHNTLQVQTIVSCLAKSIRFVLLLSSIKFIKQAFLSSFFNSSLVNHLWNAPSICSIYPKYSFLSLLVLYLLLCLLCSLFSLNHNLKVSWFTFILSFFSSCSDSSVGPKFLYFSFVNCSTFSFNSLFIELLDGLLFKPCISDVLSCPLYFL